MIPMGVLRIYIYFLNYKGLTSRYHAAYSQSDFYSISVASFGEFRPSARSDSDADMSSARAYTCKSTLLFGSTNLHLRPLATHFPSIKYLPPRKPRLQHPRPQQRLGLEPHLDNHKVGLLPHLERPHALLGKTAVRRAPRRRRDRLRDAQLELLVDRRVGGAGVPRGFPRRRDVHVCQGRVRGGRRVAPEGQHGAVGCEVCVREGAGEALWAEECGPGTQDGGVGVDGLDGGCDVEGAEARGVGGARELEVLDAVAEVGRGVGFEGVDGVVGCEVADGVAVRGYRVSSVSEGGGSRR